MVHRYAATSPVCTYGPPNLQITGESFGSCHETKSYGQRRYFGRSIENLGAAQSYAHGDSEPMEGTGKRS